MTIVRPRKGIKIFPFKDLFHYATFTPFSGKNFESLFYFFFTQITSEKDFFFPSEKKQKS